MRRVHLSSLLRLLRVEANLTQLQLAEILYQSQSYVSKYENGEQRLDLIELEAICEAVNVPLSTFIKRYLETR
jgi:transcriptional regulator with XRE-family HTH domain